MSLIYPVFSIKRYQNITNELVEILIDGCGGIKGKLVVDVVVMGFEYVHFNAAAQYKGEGRFQFLIMEAGARERLHDCLTRLYVALSEDSGIAECNKLRIVFSLGGSRVHLACRWDEEYDWFTTACDEGDNVTGYLTNKMVDDLYSWSGLTRCSKKDLFRNIDSFEVGSSVSTRKEGC